MGADCNVAVQQKLDKKTVSQLEQLETWPGLPCSGSGAGMAAALRQRSKCNRAILLRCLPILPNCPCSRSDRTVGNLARPAMQRQRRWHGSRAAPAEQMQSRYIAAMPTHHPKLSMLQV